MSWFKVAACGFATIIGCGAIGYGAGKSWSKEDREALEENPEAHEWSLEEDDGGKIQIVERKKKNGKTYSRRF